MQSCQLIPSKLKLNPEAAGHAMDRKMFKRVMIQGGFGTAGVSPPFPTPFQQFQNCTVQFGSLNNNNYVSSLKSSGDYSS
jgi:hypothetical protein